MLSHHLGQYLLMQLGGARRQVKTPVFPMRHKSQTSRAEGMGFKQPGRGHTLRTLREHWPLCRLFTIDSDLINLSRRKAIS